MTSSAVIRLTFYSVNHVIQNSVELLFGAKLQSKLSQLLSVMFMCHAQKLTRTLVRRYVHVSDVTLASPVFSPSLNLELGVHGQLCIRSFWA